MNDHERGFLSALMRKPDLYDAFPCRLEYFTHETMPVYRALSDIIEAGDKPDPVMLFDKGVPAALAAKLDMPVGNVKYYHEALVTEWTGRQLHTLHADLGAMLRDENKPGDVSSWLEETVQNLSPEGAAEIVALRKLMGPTIEEVERRFHLKGEIDGITSGMHGIDRLLNGLRGGQLIFIAARPSIGKTALALTMALNMAKKRVNVGFESLEMSRHELGVRLLAMEAKINMRAIQNGMMKESAFSEITDAANALYAAELLIDDRPNQPLDQLRSSMRQMSRKGAQVIFVDYVGLVEYGPPGMGMYERVGAIAKALKGLAREINIPIVALSQLNRQAEGNTPSLAHIAESGQIEQHADVIMMIDRDREEETGRVIIAKARNAKTGDVPVVFRSTYVRYEEEK